MSHGNGNGRGIGLSRRDMLKWMGAGAAALPALSLALRSRESRAAATARPPRMLILYTPHGAPAEYFWPQSATNLESSIPGDVSILKPLQRHAGKLNIIRGVNYVGSDNHYANRDVLTNKTASSVETVVAKKLGVQPVRLGVVPDYPESFTVDGYLSFDEGRPQQHKPDPAAVLDALFAGAPPPTTGGGGAVPAGPSAADFRRAALSPTEAELAELKQQLGSSPMAERIESHRSAVAAMRTPPTGTAPGGGTPEQPVAGCSAAPRLETVEAMRGKNVWAAENFDKVMDAQVDIAALTLSCGLSRVVSIQAGYVNHGIPFTWIGQSAGHHQLSHNSSGSPGRIDHAKCQQYFADKFATLLDKLNVPDPEDPAHTILDNTVALWCTEIADGQAHNCQSLPLVMAGGGAGYLRTGQYLQLNGRSHAELLYAMAAAMGVTDGDFGTAPGPMQEVRA
jgi:hypothetical protein